MTTWVVRLSSTDIVGNAAPNAVDPNYRAAMRGPVDPSAVKTSDERTERDAVRHHHPYPGTGLLVVGAGIIPSTYLREHPARD